MNIEKIFTGAMILICVVLLVLTYAVVKPVLIDSRTVQQTGNIAGGNWQWIQQNDSKIKTFEGDIRNLQDDVRGLRKSEKVPN